MAQDLGSRLDTIARWFQNIPFNDRKRAREFHWQVSRRGNTLTFAYDDLRLSVSGWQLVTPELWAKRELNRAYTLVSSFGVQHFYYLGDVKWSAAGQSGKGEDVIFGLPSDRDTCFGPLRLQHQVGYSVLTDLLVKLEEVLKFQYHTELLTPAATVKHEHPADKRTRVKEY